MNFDRIPDRVDLEHAVLLLAKVYSNFDTTSDHGVTHSVLQILNRCKLPKIKPVPVNQQNEAYRQAASKLHLQMWHLLQSGCNPLRKLTFRIDYMGLTSFGMEKQIQKEVIKILRVLKRIKEAMKKLKRTPWETCYIEESLKTIRTSLFRQLSRDNSLVWQDNLPIPIFGEPDYISDTTLLVESTDARGTSDDSGGIDADRCACRAKLEKLNLTVMNCCPHLVRSSSRTTLAFPDDSTSNFKTVTQQPRREWPKCRDAGTLVSSSNLVHFRSRLALRSRVRKVFRSVKMSLSNVQSYISRPA
ncbi:uncharacterized protein LOC108674152 [Hyalella azteca]|uniref:Uncharacterized protein LOC108674152 n=1 Tax=Hyalella azteca TaxID=294128 RepID=A0A8B7NXE0_HYAAZ|nr:uncharacterized protein LOC108674152 [Hyalella azteca]